jgi:NADPH-dependent 2,4-dienoyl-CoA reductase/sulfur reductase-like enzyme/ferredoxin/bacterioferritin-associated ferredoxin
MVHCNSLFLNGKIINTGDFLFQHKTLSRIEMKEYRINQHPILPNPERKLIHFYWQEEKLTAYQGETIASALFSHHIHTFGHHHKDGSPQGLFCANGQCSQCMVLVDGKPVKSCVELVVDGQHVEPLEGLPKLPPPGNYTATSHIPEYQTPVLIIGGGPSGLSAAIELGKLGVPALLVDDKHRLGGKLVLQTHRFFGSSSAVYAGTRGIDIATKLQDELGTYPSVEVWINSTALAVFSDQKIGVLKGDETYQLIKPQVLLVATGARERFLAFQGNTLPGVYGAGAFQTLVNRDLIRPAEALFIIGGGNVGLIAGYHALQAGIRVAGLAEALPQCGGYKVHKDKLHRLGVPIFTSHTILSANGQDHVNSITIAEIDSKFKTLAGTDQTFACDCILIAVGLNPINEFYKKAKDFNIPVYSAGDAEEIAEASAAIFSGRIKGLEIASFLGIQTDPIPTQWYTNMEILKSKPGKIHAEILQDHTAKVYPVLHCQQEIPCDPCSTLCPKGLITLQTEDIRSIPRFNPDLGDCVHCEKCIAGCPGLAITLVDCRKDPDNPFVSLPVEFNQEDIARLTEVTAVDVEGHILGINPIIRIKNNPKNDRTLILKIQAPSSYADKIAGIRLQSLAMPEEISPPSPNLADETIICRCERVSAGEIRRLIRTGLRDINEIKALTRAGMGACGGKTCTALIHRLYREEGIPLSKVVDPSNRPLVSEVAIGIFAGTGKDSQNE